MLTSAVLHMLPCMRLPVPVVILTINIEAIPHQRRLMDTRRCVSQVVTPSATTRPCLSRSRMECRIVYITRSLDINVHPLLL